MKKDIENNLDNQDLNIIKDDSSNDSLNVENIENNLENEEIISEEISQEITDDKSIDAEDFVEELNIHSEEDSDIYINADDIRVGDICEEQKYIEDKEIKKDKKNENNIILKSVISSSIASLLVTGGMLAMNNKNYSVPTSTITIENKVTDNVYKAVAEKATPSVVGITTLTIDTNNWFNIPLESEGVGSGVIVDSKGYILTNSHVVNDGKASKVSVMFADASTVDGKVVWNDAKLDIAIIKVEKENLEVAELGDSDKVEVGDIAIAIGNPLGLEFNKTVTQGIISGLDRMITTENGEMDDLIQTDASINPGNSGGPLLNDKGQVIGINTAKASGAEGLGFSIPINTIKPIIEQVISGGEFEKVTLGIKGIDAAQFELGVESGVYVLAIEENSPAKKADLSSGDIITELDGKKIENMTGLIKALYKYNKGDKAVLKVYKDNEEREVQVQF